MIKLISIASSFFLAGALAVAQGRSVTGKQPEVGRAVQPNSQEL
jgi:hypothetical protein